MPVKAGAPAIEARAPVTGVMIGTPMYGGQCYDAYLLGVWDFQSAAFEQGIARALSTIRNESLIPRARNRILADFMESPCSHLVFVDADIGFSAKDVFRLVAHGKPLVGATYAKKDREKYAPALVSLPGPVFQREDDGLIEVQCLPGGFLCIHRETVAQMRGHFHDLWYWDQHGESRRRIHDLFGCYTDENRQFWSEDYAFCQRWRQAGGQVWLDPNILLSHNGTTTFEGDPASLIGEAPAPQPDAAPQAAPRVVRAPRPPSVATQLEALAESEAASRPPIPLRQGHAPAPPLPQAAVPDTVPSRPDWHSIGQGDLRPVPRVLP